MAKVFTFKQTLIKKLHSPIFLILILICLFNSLSMAQSTTQPAGINGTLNLNEVGACMSSLASAQCQNDTKCISSSFQKNSDCGQVNNIFQYSGSLPAAVRQYSNISVIKLANQRFLIIDNTGKFIAPDATLSLEDAPGFLLLKTAYPSAQLTDQFQDFPIAVYLSATNNQLLFLQAIIAPPCQTACAPIAAAKVLYGFSISGQYNGADVLRIVPENE